MGLYQLRDFLSINDVADYLTEKQIHHFDLYQSDDRYKLNDFIWGLIISDKITPVFYYNGFAYDLSDKQNQEFLNNKIECKEILIFSNSMLNDWNNDRVPTINGFFQKSQAWGDTSPFPMPFNQIIQEHIDLRGKTSDFYQYKSFKNNKEYILDISCYHSDPNLLIPRVQMDSIFFSSDIYQKPKETPQTFGNFFGTPSITIVQPSIETLNQRIKERDDEIVNLKTRIAELENKLDNKELPTRTANNASKIILAMAELLQWDLSKPFSDETNGKIREILEKQGNALSKDTVGQWLKQAYDIGK